VAEADDTRGTPGLHAISPEGPLYRIGPRPDPWAFPDWANVGSDGTFGNRWDDPQGVYRVLYASSSRVGGFVEVLARFRPDPHILEVLKEIEDDEGTTAQRPGELEAATIRLSAPRSFTQEISRYVYDRSTTQGQRSFAGIAYRSRLGDEFRNWAIFESSRSRLPWIGEPETSTIEADDPDLLRALQLLGVQFVER